ncbi:unnamed protein product [Arctia plantaginis]|uniref:Uncharacterized protein n=1 Tax=Arctia plantaginis TaxID=874455 RepID=A0A8S1AN32_ARCPL|nr:unnamed protein product [Arctia plantaginis]
MTDPKHVESFVYVPASVINKLQIEAGAGEGPGPPVNNNSEGAVASPPRDDNHNAQQPPVTPRPRPLTPAGKICL